MRAAKETTESPELADRFNRVLNDTVEALEDAKIKVKELFGELFED